MSTAPDRRPQRLALLEDDIGRHLAASEDELRRAKSWGRPLDFGDGYDETPDALKMPMKVLRDAGVVPPEVELMQQIAALATSLEGADEADPEARARRARLAEMRQALALRLEKLRTSGSL